MTTLRSAESPAVLLARADAAKAEHPRLRPRDLALHLGVSEAELLDARVGADVVRLRPDLALLLERLPGVGRVMTLTRNEAAVHERRGTYQKGWVRGHVGLVVGPEIDLRLFPTHWVAAYRVVVHAGTRTLDSIQVFDAHGVAVEKIYAEGDSDRAAWEALIADLTHEDQAPGTFFALAEPAATPPVMAESFDRDAFLSGWAELSDTHHFHGLLRTHQVSYGAAFTVAEGRFTRRLPVSIALSLLEQASETSLPIMVFVGNRGCIQIHTGPVKRILARNGWTNVLDPDFNLHLKDDLVASAWAVSKPTDDGVVTSVELLDENGGVLVRFFGERKPGKPELPAWRALVDGLTTLSDVLA
jgi:putative hemin transport protein